MVISIQGMLASTQPHNQRSSNLLKKKLEETYDFKTQEPIEITYRENFLRLLVADACIYADDAAEGYDDVNHD